MSEEREKRYLHIDLKRLSEISQKGAVRAYMVVSIAQNIQTLESLDLYPYTQAEPGFVPIHLLPDNPSDEQIEEYRQVFSQWVIGNALRELVEMFAIFLDEMYKYVLIVEGVLLSDIPKQMKSFEGKGVIDKLAVLKDYGIETGLVNGLETINTARNCLTHRAGIVGLGIRGENDLNDGQSLTLKWRYMEIVIQYSDGKEEKWIQGAKREPLPEGTSILTRVVDRTRTVPKGERLVLHPNDIGEIGWNFVQASVDIGKSFEKYLRGKGVPFIDDETSA